MIRKLLVAALLALLPAAAEAANCSGNPFTLTNGQTADATQVMANFNNLLNCSNNNLAHNGANSDITSLSALSTPLSVTQGGTGAATFTATAGLLVGNGISAFTTIAPSTTGNLLVSTGTAWAGTTTLPAAVTHAATVTMSGAVLNEAFVTSAATPSGNVLDLSGIAANFINLTGTGMGTINSFGNLPAGAERTLRFNGAAPGVLSNSANLTLPNAISITIGQNDIVKIRSFGSSSSEVVAYLPYLGAPIYGKAGTASAFAGTDTSQFVTPGSLGGNTSPASSGFIKYPGGVVMQWGATTVAGSSQSTVTFPVAFATSCDSVTAAFNDTATSVSVPGASVGAGSLTATNFALANGSGGSHLIGWMAFGH